MEIVSSAIETYCANHSTAASALLNEVEQYTERHHPDAQMLIGPLEAAFLQLIVRATGARRILEIGTFTGYSALALAEALAPEGEIVTCEIDPKHAEIARGFFARSPHAHKIALRLGPALDTLERLAAGGARFDFAFIDADKENYIDYYERVLALLPPGGLIVADNVLWSGRVLAPREPADRAIAQFNRHVHADPRVESVVLPLRDGVTFARKR